MSAIDTLLNNELNNGEITLTVDEQTRSIKYDGSLLLGVENDYQAERLYFIAPKMVGDGIDLSLDTVLIYINFQNAYGEPYIYECTDKSVLEDGTVKFSWLLTEKVTETKGNVKFMVCVKNMVNDMLHNEWHTAPFEGQVLKGIDVSNKTPEIIADTTASTAALIRQLQESEEAMDAAVQRCDDIVSGYEATIAETVSNLQGYTKDEVDEFKNDSDYKIDDVDCRLEDHIKYTKGLEARNYFTYEDLELENNCTWGQLIDALELASPIPALGLDEYTHYKIVLPHCTFENLGLSKMFRVGSGSYIYKAYWWDGRGLRKPHSVDKTAVTNNDMDEYFTNAGGRVNGNVIVINEDETNGVVIHREGKITGYDSTAYIRFAPENGNIYYASYEDVQKGVERELGKEKQSTAYTLFSGDESVYGGTSENGISQTTTIMLNVPTELDNIKVGDRMRVYFYGGPDSPGTHSGILDFEFVKTSTNGGITGGSCFFSHGAQSLIIGASSSIFDCTILVHTLGPYSGYEPSKNNRVHVNKIELIRYS